LIGEENFERSEAGERVEEVLELERALMNGRILDGAIELATWIEDGVRRLLRQAALGELGSDLSATADETLIATGLEAGDAEITVYAADDFEEEEEAPMYEEPAAEEFRVVEVSPGMTGREAEDMPVDGTPSSSDRDHDLILSRADEDPVEDAGDSYEE